MARSAGPEHVQKPSEKARMYVLHETKKKKRKVRGGEMFARFIITTR
jgi:hypothetical protein